VFFNVRDLEVRKAQFDVAIPPGQIDFEDQKLRQITPLQAQGTVELLVDALNEIRVNGHLNVQVEAGCDRCLETVRFPLDAPFDLFYRPADSIGGRQEFAIDEGESEIGFYEGNGLDLDDILREEVLLLLPMQRVCSEACKGICPICGQNRNQVQCDCHAQTIDDRWSALKNL